MSTHRTRKIALLTVWSLVESNKQQQILYIHNCTDRIIQITASVTPDVNGSEMQLRGKASAYGVVVVGSIPHGEPIDLSILSASAARLVNKGQGTSYHLCTYKITLLLMGKSSPCRYLSGLLRK